MRRVFHLVENEGVVEHVADGVGTALTMVRRQRYSIINRTQTDSPRPQNTARPWMPDHVGEKATHASTSKRRRDVSEYSQSPPFKRSKLSPARTTSPTESTISYDACPMPSVEDYFYEDLVPKASELSQLFPTLCHDAYLVRRWLGPAGCAIHWTMVLEDINGTTDVPNRSHSLAGLIAHSLAKRRGPQWRTSSPKFYALCETLKSHLGLEGAHRITVFSEFQQPEVLPEANLK